MFLHCARVLGWTQIKSDAHYGWVLNMDKVISLISVLCISLPDSTFLLSQWHDGACYSNLIAVLRLTSGGFQEDFDFTAYAQVCPICAPGKQLAMVRHQSAVTESGPWPHIAHADEHFLALYRAWSICAEERMYVLCLISSSYCKPWCDRLWTLWQTLQANSGFSPVSY